METSDFLTPIRRALEPYDPLDLVTGLGALQLVPENANHLQRLEIAAAATAGMRPSAGHPLMSNQRWRVAVNGAPIADAQLLTLEDPNEHPFTEALTFHGGSYVVFPGLEADAPFILRQVLYAIFRLPPWIADPDFNREAHRSTFAVLMVSEAVAQRAVLRRNAAPGPSSHGMVTVPFPAPFERLKAAVDFSADELEALLGTVGLGLDALDPLVCEQGAPDIAYQVTAPIPMLLTPIIRTHDHYVVASPGALLIALRHHLIQLAIERGHRNELADRFREAILRNVVRSVETYLDCPSEAVPPFDFGSMPVDNRYFALDRDKVLDVIVVTDRLDGYDPASPFGIWDASSIIDAVQDRLGEVEEHVFAIAPPGKANEILHLIVVQGVGRVHTYSIDGLKEPVCPHRLGLSASDLEIISLRMAGHQLALWQFAEAADAVRDAMAIVAMGMLDEFAHYLSHDESYYLGDDPKPTVLAIPPGGAGALHREVLDRLDTHAVVGPEHGTLVEVVRWNPDERIPSYAPLSPLEFMALCSEALKINVWIVGPRELPDVRYEGLYSNFGRMLAYWIWQLAPSLDNLLQPDTHDYDPLVVHLEMVPSEAWFLADQDGSIVEQPPITCRFDGAGLYLSIAASALRLLEGPDNTGEREVLRIFLRTLLDLPGLCTRYISDEEIGTILDLHAPLGLKKMTIFTRSSANLLLDNRELGLLRTVQPAETHRVLDETGRFLLQDRGLPVGPIPHNQRVEVLNAVVAHLIAELERLVATLSPDGLLELLVACNETLLTRQAVMRLTIPTYLACFASEADLVDDLRTELPKLATALIANRFLIEYVTARPPCGLRHVSLAVYDRLMAIAAETVNRAFVSDVIHYGLSDIVLGVTPSERLGMERGAYDAAMNLFSSEHAFGEISRSRDDFENYWKDDDLDPGTRNRVTEMDNPSLEEFGLSIEDLLAFLRETIDASERLSGAAKVMDLDSFAAGLGDALNWPHDRVMLAVELFAARPRARFDAPPPPYQPRDAFPGNFARGLSYLRKPLLVRPGLGGREELIWGNRNVFLSGKYLWNLILIGRLDARSNAMKAAMSRLQNEESEAFNERVFQVFDAPPASLARMKVTAIGNLPIARQSGEDLGDIDVLAADVLRRRLVAVEVKDLAGARTPREVSNELKVLFRGAGSDRSTVDKHADRIAWLSGHVREVLEWFGLPGYDAAAWIVEPLIVLDKETPAPTLAGATMPVTTFHRLRAERS